MITKVPCLHEAQIERDAAALLAEYEQARGVTIAPPIPIEDIVEKHLKLCLEFDDTHRLFGVQRSGSGTETDILGAISFAEARIVIDESLDPELNPAMEGRYRFTLAHEGGGHWRLHRHLFATEPTQAALSCGPAAPPVVWRASQAAERIEWQADFYAACLLMPRELIFATWGDMFPDRKPRVLQPRTPITHPYVEIPRDYCPINDLVSFETDDEALDRFAQPLAETFLVPRVAMRIRLEKLGLLLREVPQRCVLANGW